MVDTLPTWLTHSTSSPRSRTLLSHIRSGVAGSANNLRFSNFLALGEEGGWSTGTSNSGSRLERLA